LWNLYPSFLSYNITTIRKFVEIAKFSIPKEGGFVVIVFSLTLIRKEKKCGSKEEKGCQN